MKKIGITLLGVGALVGFNAIALARDAPDSGMNQGISDRELFEAASLATVSTEGAVTAGHAVLTQAVTPLGEALEGSEGPEGPDLDGPGGSTLEFEGEQTGDH